MEVGLAWDATASSMNCYFAPRSNRAFKTHREELWFFPNPILAPVPRGVKLHTKYQDSMRA